MCERPVDGFSWSPPGRALQADALRELVAVHDVLLQGAFPELLSAGPAAGRLRVPVWWPTQTNRQGDGCPLGPHVVDGLQLLLRGGARRQEALHRQARRRGKHFREKKKNNFFLFFQETHQVKRVRPHRQQGDFCVSMIRRGGALRCKNPRHAQFKRGGGSKGTRMQ